MTKRERVIILLTFLVILFAIFWHILFQPLQQEIQEKKSEIEKYNNDIKVLKINKKDLQNFDQDQNIEILSNLIPGKKELEYTIDQIFSILEQYNLKLDFFEFETNEMDDCISSVDIKGHVEGEYRDIYNVLEEIQGFKRHINIRSIHIRNLNNFNSTNVGEILSVNLHLETYFDGYNLLPENKLTSEDDIGKINPFTGRK
nr:type 4a pilus biogenesis protein PilO [Natranaerobius trueperi]